MGRVERRRKLARLEARATATRTVLADLAEARKARLLAEAVGRLSDADLTVLGEILDAAIKGCALMAPTTTNLYQFAATKRERQALAALGRALAAAESEADKELVRGERHA